MERYDDFQHHPDMMYELRMWEEIKDEMGYEKSDDNQGLIYGVYWLDDNDECVDVEWFKTEQERHAEVYKTNEQLKKEEL